jgi:hypothetical protein
VPKDDHLTGSFTIAAAEIQAPLQQPLHRRRKKAKPSNVHAGAALAMPKIAKINSQNCTVQHIDCHKIKPSNTQTGAALAMPKMASPAVSPTAQPYSHQSYLPRSTACCNAHVQ